MRVVGVTEFGPPSALAVHEVPEPHARSGEVRIRVQAAAVSPTDAQLRAGVYGTMGQRPPFVPGMDAAGVVDEVGPGAPWQLGQHLMAIALPRGGGRGGAYAEYLAGPWQSMTPVPRGMDPVTAATLPMNGLTALQALRRLGLRPGQTLVVTGAAGTLGSYVVELAKCAGLVVVADASAADRPWVARLGADHVLDRGDGMPARARSLTAGGADAVVDAAVLHQAVLPAVRDGGAVAAVRRWPGEPPAAVTVHHVQVREDFRCQRGLTLLRQLAEEEVLRPRVAETFPAERADCAHRRLEAGGVRGRVVLTF